MGRIDWERWDGGTLWLSVMEMDRRFPEHELSIGPGGIPIDHDNPWHLESIFGHACDVIDAGRVLSMRYHLSASDHAILMVSCTWHDAGKIIVRAPKERFVCTSCGRPSVSERNPCPCGGTMRLTTVMGYHSHEIVSASDWLFGNVCIREGIPASISGPARRVIADHRWLGDALVAGGIPPSGITLPHILMCWADDKGRTRAPFDDFDFERAFSEIVGGMI